MKKNLITRVGFSLLMSMIVILTIPLIANAESKTYDQNTLKHSSDTLEGVKLHKGEDVTTVEMPNVTMEKAKDFVEKKGFDLIGLAQVLAQPLTILVFFIGGFMALAGSLGHGSSMMKGVIVMGIAVIVYASIMAGPQLVDMGNQWLKT